MAYTILHFPNDESFAVKFYQCKDIIDIAIFAQKGICDNVLWVLKH